VSPGNLSRLPLQNPSSAVSAPLWRPESDDTSRYLEDTIHIDWQTPEVLAKARELCAEASDSRERIRRCFEFVRDEIKHSIDIESDLLTCRASQVLREGSGLCFAKSHLLAALLRAVGIPAGFCYQRLRRDAPATGHSLHGLNGVYLADEARWILLDARGDNDHVATEFRPEGEPSLAYRADPERGEELLPTIFKRPGKRVLEQLERAPSLESALRHLADSPN
jgi:hypothetical protein